MKKKSAHLIFDLFGVIFLFDKYRALKKIGFWRVFLFVLKYRKNPMDHCFFLLDQMRLHNPEEFQDLVAYKGLFLPKSLCLWQQGLLNNQETMQRIMRYLRAVPDNIILDRILVENIVHTAFTTQAILSAMVLNKSLYKQILELKKHHSIYILSNIDPETWRGIQLKYPQVISLFNGMVISGEKHLLKPGGEIFNYVCEKYQLSPRECVMIDDQPENCATAQRIGMRTILYKQGCSIIKTLRSS